MAKAKRTRVAQPIIDPSLPIKAVTRNSVWGLQEDDAIRMWKAATKDAEVKKNVDRYLDIFKSAFLIEEVKEDITLVKKNYEQRGYKVAQIMFDEMMMFTWAIKKKSITHANDLTHENIGYISTTELLEVLNRNFGGGWGSLSRSIQNIIHRKLSLLFIKSRNLNRVHNHIAQLFLCMLSILLIDCFQGLESFFHQITLHALRRLHRIPRTAIRRN
jgi:hypothetical protein